MANPYSILGVQKTADEKAVKSAFRKLAKKFHPDQNKDDKNAKERFAEVNQAYEIIGDKEKRAQFDRGEIDEKGNPKFAGFGDAGGGGDPFSQFRHSGGGGRNSFGSGGFAGAEDILSEMFGSSIGGKARGFSPQAGAARRHAEPSLDIEMKARLGLDELMRGKASVIMPDGKQLSISIPPEAENKQVIRLKGKGKSVPGRKNGDALVTLNIQPNPKFIRQGADLRHDAPLELKVAVLGGKMTVETLDGKLSMKIPAGTNSGQIFRLKGKGLPKKSGGYGDLLVIPQIQLPDDRLNELKSVFERD